MNFFRLQHSGVSIEEMKSHTSDYISDAGYMDEYMFDSTEEYEAAVREQEDTYNLTICASRSACEKSWGGARGAFAADGSDGEVVVLTGTVVMDIYDGVRLYSPSLVEVARFPLGEWERMQDAGETEQYE